MEENPVVGAWGSDGNGSALHIPSYRHGKKEGESERKALQAENDRLRTRINELTKPPGTWAWTPKDNT